MKKIIAATLTLILILCIAGCNMQVIDTTWSFKWAQLRMTDGTIVEGKIDSWKDFENSDQLQIKIDGVTYLVHSVNVVMLDVAPRG